MSKESIQESQYHFPYHHLTYEANGSFYLFRHLFWGLEHYTYIQFVIDQVVKNNPASIADVGCGEGRILSILETRLNNTQLAGYDISENALHFARGFTYRSTFTQHDITREALPKTVDTIVSCEVIEHIPPEQVSDYCKNISQSLLPGGTLFLTTPTTNIPVNSKHYQHFTLETLKTTLDPYFSIEEVVYLNRHNKMSAFINRIIANRLYLSNISVVNNWALKQYKKSALFGTAKTGSRIYIKATKK